MAGDASGDLLSFLPDDLLHEILLRLDSVETAAQTSLLSRNWRYFWAQIPDLKFPLPGNLDHVRYALTAYDSTNLRDLHITTCVASPELVEAILFLAAPLLTGEIFIEKEMLSDDETEGEEDELEGEEDDLEAEVEEEWVGRGDAFELPCFHRATKIYLNLYFLGLKMPTSGVFIKLVSLYLYNMWLDGCCDLGELVSSARCPLLQELGIDNIHGITNLAIRSKSLLQIQLHSLEGLQKITIVAPMLDILDVQYDFATRQLVADISAPALRTLYWDDMFDLISAKFNEMVHLMNLSTSFMVYGIPGSSYNSAALKLLQYSLSRDISILELFLNYPDIMDNCQYLMEAISILPDTKTLSLGLLTSGHVFGPCVFYLLSLSTGIRNLKLKLCWDSQEQTTCSLGCICYQPETDDILLNSLMEVEIIGFYGTEHEFAFVERLLRWAANLNTITLSFQCGINTVTEEL
ncbi:uncharacterized protein LOC112270600 [Brachypodium distachyon]|uniref:uncharacterized protein LOC112270600 n=1 Tax=Brachypodium distachyon TaxID=15368 RepID=UPI0005300058|nr:uncharacterized protein LOC112270600 [Brachypodium distachyon]|eukprot:XP_024314149.1 uncharacterized protein LOC112270600 [Brachypodium distachyon]